LEDQGILDPNQDGGGEEDQPHDEILAELERCQSELRSGRTVNQSGRPASPQAFNPTFLTPDPRIQALLIPDLDKIFCDNKKDKILPNRKICWIKEA
jgi:hypothetical protein